MCQGSSLGVSIWHTIVRIMDDWYGIADNYYSIYFELMNRLRFVTTANSGTSLMFCVGAQGLFMWADDYYYDYYFKAITNSFYRVSNSQNY